MKPLSYFPAKRHCLISVAGVGGAFLGWNFWFTSGGWQRHEHWGEGILWGISAIVGLWGAIDAIRFDRGSSWVTAVSLLLCLFHMLSFLLFLLFLEFLANGGPRP